MTDAEKHADKRFKEAVKYVSHQWGNGWNRLGRDIREALIRAEILAEISRIGTSIGIESAAYHALVDAMSTRAVQWDGEV